MALGGYFFTGHKCSRSVGTSDAEWALLIHKTRIKSFIEAAEYMNEWSFYNTDGSYSFENYGNVIHDINSSGGMNLVSFFRYYNDEKYFAIVSMFNQTTNFNKSAAGVSNYSGQSRHVFGSGRTCFEVVSLEPFANTGFMLEGSVYPSKALSMMPISNPTPGSSATIPLVTPNTNDTFFKATSCYFGYAVKGKNILSFASTNANSPVSESPYIFCTAHAFDALELSSPSDTYNIFSSTFNASQLSETANTPWSGTSSLSKINFTLKSDGTRYNKEDIYCGLSLSKSPSRAVIGHSYNVIPFESVNLCPDSNITTPMSVDGVCSKGMIDVEFISMNGGTTYSYFTKYIPYANGNYIMINYNREQYPMNECNYYVGWDPSNPEITSEGAWSEYTGS